MRSLANDFETAHRIYQEDAGFPPCLEGFRLLTGSSMDWGQVLINAVLLDVGYAEAGRRTTRVTFLDH